MGKILRSATAATPFLIVAGAAIAQAPDCYQQREERYRGEQWRLHLFAHVRTDLEHVWGGLAKDKELARPQKTEDELTKMQADLDETDGTTAC